MGVPPDEQCGGESGGVRTDPSLTVVGQHPKDEEYHPSEPQYVCNTMLFLEITVEAVFNVAIYIYISA